MTAIDNNDVGHVHTNRNWTISCDMLQKYVGVRRTLRQETGICDNDNKLEFSYSYPYDTIISLQAGLA